MVAAMDESEVAGAKRDTTIGDGGSGGNKRSFTDSHLKDLHAVFVQN